MTLARMLEIDHWIGTAIWAVHALERTDELTEAEQALVRQIRALLWQLDEAFYRRTSHVRREEERP